MLNVLVPTYYDILRFKHSQLLERAGHIKTLALGSSHGDFGFNPQFYPESFNLCCRSQDLKYSYLLYEKSGDLSPGIENIVLFYSVFSPGSFLEKTPNDKLVAVILNFLFDLNLSYEELVLNQVGEALEKATIHPATTDNYFHGYILRRAPNEYFSPSFSVTERVQDHLKYNARHEALPYLKKILDLAQERGHRVFIVVPPVRSDYRRELPDDLEPLFASMMDVLNEAHPDLYINVMNFMDSPMFPDDYFGDSDHLHFQKDGVEILTSFIADTIKAA